MAMIEQTSFGTGYKLKECIDRKREILKLKNVWWCPDVESDGNYMVYGEPTLEEHFWHSIDSAIAKYTLIKTQNENNEDTTWLNTCFWPMKPGFEIHQIF